MAFEIYHLNKKGIKKTDSIDPNFIVVIKNTKNQSIYIWRSLYFKINQIDRMEDLDELYDLVEKLFSDMKNIYVLTSIKINEFDSEEIKEIKKFIQSKFENKEQLKKNLTSKLGIFEKIKGNINIFRRIRLNEKLKNKILGGNKGNSRSNFEKLWRLSVHNILILGAIMILLFYLLIAQLLNNDFIFIQDSNTLNQPLLQSWIALLRIVIIIGCIGILILFVYNLLFVLFPLEFPSKIFKFNLIGQESRISLEEMLNIISEKEFKPQELAAPIVPTEEKLELIEQKNKKSESIGSKTKLKGDLSKIRRKTEDIPAEIVYRSEEEKELGIPAIPPPPKKKLNVKPSAVYRDLDIGKDSNEKKVILAHCDICKKTVHIKINKKLVLESELPAGSLVDISFVHGNPPHAIFIQVDKQFYVRRKKACPVFFEND
ncbi:MAG: hypothetical protein ACTSRZ_21180 [Promethearchaeota archaeon]